MPKKGTTYQHHIYREDGTQKRTGNYKIALLESVGACPNRLQRYDIEFASDSSCTSEGEWSDYEYETGDDEEDEVQSRLGNDQRDIARETPEEGERTRSDSSIECKGLQHPLNDKVELDRCPENCIRHMSQDKNGNKDVQESFSDSDGDSWSKVSSLKSDSSGVVLVEQEDCDDTSHQFNLSNDNSSV